MKKLLPFVVILLLLSGCSSQSSIDDQVKLLEYEKCLDIETSWFLQQFAGSEYLYQSYRDILKEENTMVTNWMISKCESFKP